MSLNPDLLQIIQAAAAASSYDVHIVSEVRGKSASAKGNHDGGHAIDIQLVDTQTGNALPNKYFQKHPDSPPTVISGAAEAYPAYEQFAQTARVYQQENFPQYDRVFRWGGGFLTGGTTGDMMHFDVTPGAAGRMALYDWDKGYVGGDALPGAVSNGGLGGADGARRATQIRNQLTDAGGLTPASSFADRGVPRPRPASLTTPVGINPSLAGGAGTAAPPARPLGDALSPAAMNGVLFGHRIGKPAFEDFATATGFGSRGMGSVVTDPRADAMRAPARDIAAASAGALGQQTSASAGAALGNAGTLTASGAAQPSNTAASGAASLAAAPAAGAPVPASRPIAAQVAPTPYQRPVQTASASSAAPAPMPGRPADTAPTRTAATNAATNGPALVRLAGGEMIAVGMYPSNDGVHVTQVTDDGTGKAKITKILSPGEIPGVINPMREVTSNTVAGGVIRSAIGNAVGDTANAAASSLTDAAQGLPGADTAVNAVSGLGQIGSLFSSALGNFGNFGNAATTAQNNNSSSRSTATLQDIHDRNEDRVVAASTPALGSTSTGATALGAAAAPITTYRTQTNPAFTDWQQQYGDVTVQPLAITRLQDIHDREDDRRIAASTPQAAASVPAAPARTIQVAVQSSGGSSSGSRSSGGSSSGGSSTASAAAPQTFQGTSTGRTYIVGNTYSNGNGSYIAQPDGTFDRI